MSVVACITVHLCDGCGFMQSLQTNEEYVSFGATWYDGWRISLCPVCREEAKHLSMIIDDQKLQRSVTEAIKTFSTRKEKENVRFISIN